MDFHDSHSALPNASRTLEGLAMTFVGGSVEGGHAPAVDPAIAPRSLRPGPRLPLAMAQVGDRLWIVQIQGGATLTRRLRDMGLNPGCEIAIVSRTESGSVVVGFQGCRLGLGAGMAHRVLVSPTPPPPPHSSTPSSPPGVQAMESMEPTVPPLPSPDDGPSLQLSTLAVGQSGRIVGYEKGQRAYREKLLSMGLTPGTSFTLTRKAPLGDPLELLVRGYKLSLRKDEAALLRIVATE